MELDPQLKTALGKASMADSKDFGGEFYDAGERSIFDGDDFELAGK